MKQFGIAAILVLFLTCSSLILFAQKHKIGIDFGYGQTRISDNLQEKGYFSELKGDYWTTGASYFYTLGKSIVDVGSGINLTSRGVENMQLYYLSVPISVDFHYGNVVEFTAGGGVSADILLSSNVNESELPGSNPSIDKKQFRIFFRGGLIYKFNERYWLKMQYNYQVDLSPAYKANKYYGLGPAESFSGWYGADHYLSLSLGVNLGKSISE